MKLGSIVRFLPLLFVFVASLYPPKDTDLGWHLAYGKHFFENGSVLRENIFSTLMPNYRWVNSSWLTDLVSFQVFNNFGFLGLSILGAIIITLTFFFFSKASKLNFYEESLIFPLLVFFLSPINQVSFRGQLFSLLFLGIVYYLLRLWEEHSTKSIFLLIPLFALWSNLHGQFLLGLGFMGIWAAAFLIVETVKEGFASAVTKNRFLIIVLLGSLIAPLINPFGFGVYQESFKHMANPLLKTVVEWLPFEELSGYWTSQFVLGILTGFSLLIIIFGKNPLSYVAQLLVFIVFFVMAFLVRRFSWPMYYFSMPILAPFAKFLSPDSKLGKIWGTVILVSVSTLLLFLVNNPIKRVSNMTWESYCQALSYCSSASAEYIINNKLEGNFLNTYDWGGWLIWNYPQIPTAIDGRMHLWRDETGYSAFEEYYAYEQNKVNINESKFDLVLMSKRKPVYDQLEQLRVARLWEKLYQDDTAAVFRRK